MPEANNLSRFVAAQEPIYARALEEIRHGQKETHWMWFIFPQIAGLGQSPTARHFAIQNLEEAEAYLKHPILGARLLECCEAILQVNGKSAYQILGSPDDMKLRSSMTLFASVQAAPFEFSRVLAKYYAGQLDPKTLEILRNPTV